MCSSSFICLSKKKKKKSESFGSMSWIASYGHWVWEQIRLLWCRWYGGPRLVANQRFRCLGCCFTFVVVAPIFCSFCVSFCCYTCHVFPLCPQGPSLFLLQSATLLMSWLHHATFYFLSCSPIGFLFLIVRFGDDDRCPKRLLSTLPFCFLSLFFHTFIVGIDLWVWRKGRFKKIPQSRPY